MHSARVSVTLPTFRDMSDIHEVSADQCFRLQVIGCHYADRRDYYFFSIVEKIL